MRFDYPGYHLYFIQKQKCKDDSQHLFTLKYKFFSPITKYWYILHADYHEENVFALKFYCKKDRRSEYKYSKIVNKGDIGNILMSCANAVPLLLKEYPSASFGFGAARSVDRKNNTIEPYNENQRFLAYSYIAKEKFGMVTFTHFEYPMISCYLLINNSSKDILTKEALLNKMFLSTYPNLLSV